MRKRNVTLVNRVGEVGISSERMSWTKEKPKDGKVQSQHPTCDMGRCGLGILSEFAAACTPILPRALQHCQPPTVCVETGPELICCDTRREAKHPTSSITCFGKRRGPYSYVVSALYAGCVIVSQWGPARYAGKMQGTVEGTDST